MAARIASTEPRRGTRVSHGSHCKRSRRGYVLLETVVATGLLVVGLAVIGAQVQDADFAVRDMKREIRAIELAQQQLAEMDLGLIALDSVDEIQEEDFGPRYPDWAWRMTIEDTAIEQMFLLKLEVLYLMREDEYQEDGFEYDDAETLFTLYTMRATPQPVDFAADFGLNDEEMTELSEKLSDLGIEGLDPEEFDLALLGDIDFEELMTALPVLMDAFNLDPMGMAASLPPGFLQQLQDNGVLPGGGEGEGLLDGLLDGGGP